MEEKRPEFTAEWKRREEIQREEMTIEGILIDYRENHDGEIRYKVYRNVIEEIDEYVVYDEVTGYFQKANFDKVLKILRP